MQTADEQTPSARRGRQATSPREIPARGWKDIGKRVLDEMRNDNLSIVAAGVALYWFLALFPTLIALFSIYGLISDPAQVEQQLAAVTAALPSNTHGFLLDQMQRLAAHQAGALGWGVVIGILVALWSASKGVRAMMEALNIVYDQTEARGFAKKYLVGLGLTLLLILLGGLAIGVIAVLPAVAQWLGLEEAVGIVIDILKWPLLLGFVVLVLGLLYRWAPAREDAEWRWITPGSTIAGILWLVASWAFSLFVQNFSSYSNTYGSLAAVIILILWLNLSAFVVLLGGEINAEMEHQTSHDSTTGEERDMGQRGAHVADTLGETSEDRAERSA